MYCQCTDACGGREEWEKETKKMSLGNKWEGEYVGRIMQHQVNSEKNVRRTVVTKATQSIHTQTTASPIHRKNKD